MMTVETWGEGRKKIKCESSNHFENKVGIRSWENVLEVNRRREIDDWCSRS